MSSTNDFIIQRTASTPREAAPYEKVLSNGTYRTRLTAAGSGYSVCGKHALTRWAGDRTRDADGFFFYVRDLEHNTFWSAGIQPTRHAPDDYEALFSDNRVSINRRDSGIETRMDVCVAPEDNVELRRLTLVNRSDRPRRLEVTSYAEVVLHDPAADAAHPAFSKLFVQTEKLADRPVLLARRRLRSPDEAPIWLAHFTDGASDGWETDRLRFLGRGRTAAAPQALDPGVALSGTVGNVLDPVLSLRRTVTLAPGEATTLIFGLAVAAQRPDVVALAARYRHAEVAAAAFARTSTPAAPLQTPFVSPPDDASPRFCAATLDASVSNGSEFKNGYGGFSDDGSEYIIHLAPNEDGRLRLPPLPWVNVLANENVGGIVSERGSMHTWGANSREHRLTPWYNDPVSDPTGEAVYLRDEESGVFWSALPAPCPAAMFEVRHGWGYTVFRHDSQALAHEVTVFVPASGDAVKVTRLCLTNHGDRPRRLSLTSYARLVLGDLPEATAPHIRTAHAHTEDGHLVLLATNPEANEFAENVAFAALTGAHAFTTDRVAFLGRLGDLATPQALVNATDLEGATGASLDPCFALRASLSLEPGQTIELNVLLGEAASPEAAVDLAARYLRPGTASQTLEATKTWWREAVTAVQIETPESALDLMVNGWLAYQNLACRMLGRTAYYQSGGAYGFRDQLQDAAALVYALPDLTRRQILHHAAHQFAEGDVLHWWHPPTSKGIRTRFADDLLWLPYVTAFYIETTGDRAILEEDIRYLTAPLLAEGIDEAFLTPEDSGTSGTLYEHLCRALDRSLTRGAHGLPLMGTGDWNDGMNRVGRLGKGESVWLGFFLADILKRWIPRCEARGDAAHATTYRAYLADLEGALNNGGWDGAWYRRAYYDDGTPIGSKDSDECQIDAIAQAWAVLSGVAPPERAQQALDALETHLVDEQAGIIRLLTPAFDQTPHDPGYIKGYVPGVRENGGQYTHGALWAVRALAEAGRCDRAAPLLALLSPVHHTRSREAAERYQTEPYVVAADVYGVAPHVGRGGWTWYTGSAGWMWRVAVESVCGLTVADGDTLVLRPCIPRSWDGFQMTYRLPGGDGIYEINVRRGALSASLDGERVALDDGTVRVPLLRDGKHHRVELTFPR